MTDMNPTRNCTQMLHRSGLHTPRILTLSITDCCNLQCRHCFVDAGKSLHATAKAPVIKRLAREFAAIGGSGVRFTGGEPLCHPKWLELVRHARSIGFERVFLQTNGTLMNERDAAALREMDFPGLSIQVSLDGATEASHDLVRAAGAFSAALSGIRHLVRAGLGSRVVIFFTEMRHNILELPALLELAESLSVNAVVSGTLVSHGRARNDTSIQPPEPQQYLALLERYETDQHFRELYSRFGSAPFLEWSLDTPRSEPCTFVENPYITSAGVLYPCVLCHADDFAVPGLFEKSLDIAFEEGAHLWTRLQKISAERCAATEECLKCPGAGSCAGGCMGRAWASCRDFMAADDRCSLRKSIYTRLSSPG
jgi:radical SAM protein with 4Fe4S-binding SPASM domain